MLLKTTIVFLFFIFFFKPKKNIFFFFFLLTSLFSYFIFLILKNKYFVIYVDYFSVSMFVLVVLTYIFSLFFLDTKIYKNNNILYIYSIFLPILFILFFSNNFLTFFFFYELLLIPSVYLTFISSPSIRSKNVSMYFLFWTQFGSFLIFISILLLVYKTNNYCFSNFYFLNFSRNEYFFIKFLIFFGFGIKIPFWPFHFWLTKTHVEANTSFSIFLSGVLVKTALFGFYKFFFFFKDTNVLLLLIVFIGILDSGIKLFSQVDLKKIVALSTVFEMNIIAFNFFFFSHSSYLFIIYFCVLHTILSFYFFYTVDLIYKRYNTRSTMLINNLINLYPILSFFLILGVLIFNGIPLTLKFNLEIIFFSKLLNLSIVYFIFFVFIQIVLVIFFSKAFFSLLFNSSTTFNFKFLDLTKKEIFLYFILIFILIILSFF